MTQFIKRGDDNRAVAFGKRVDGPAGRRRAKRNSVAIRAEIVTDAATIDVKLIDLSNSGVKLRGSKLPALDQLVSVRIGPMEAPGTVAWTEGNMCGIQFGPPSLNDEVDIAWTNAGTPSPLTN
ncbi:MAG: PilZ domain-containing protein [Sphingomicrobium sp.]